MDALVELIPLLLVAGYYLLAARRRAAQKRALRERALDVPEVGTEERGPTPFQDFMSQLEEAMAEAAGETIDEPEPPAPDPVETIALPRRPDPAPRPSEFRPVFGSFDASQPTDHEAHGFGPANPISEERFERFPVFHERPRTPKRSYDPHGLHTPPPVAEPGRRLGNLRRRLRDSDSAREAFVLQTIFGPRGGRRGENR